MTVAVVMLSEIGITLVTSSSSPLTTVAVSTLVSTDVVVVMVVVLGTVDSNITVVVVSATLDIVAGVSGMFVA